MSFSVSYIYSIQDRYSSKLAKIKRATDKFRTSMSKAQLATKKFAGKLNGMQSTAASVAGALGGAVALNVYKSFETQMNNLGAVSLTTKDKLQKMRDVAKDLGATTKFTATQAAAGMEKLKLAGLSVNEILKAIPSTLQLAAAGSMDMATAADISTGIMGGMELKIKDLSRINDVLALAQSKARFNISQLSESFGPVANTAAKAGLTLEQLTATLGIMAEGGQRGSLAGTLLMNALLKIRTATRGQRRIYRRLGVDLSKYMDKLGRFTDYEGFVEHMKQAQAAGKILPKYYKKLFDIRGLKSMQILFGKTKLQVRSFTKSLEGAGGTAKRMTDIQMKGLPGMLLKLKSVSEALVIALFESGLGNWLVGIGEGVIRLIRRMKNMNPVILKIIASVSTFVVVAGPMLFVLGLIVSGIGALLNPVVGAIALFTLLGGGIAWLATKNKGLSDAFGRLWESLVSIWQGIKIILKPISWLIDGFFSLFGVSTEGAGALDLIAYSISVVVDAVNLLLLPLKLVVTFLAEIGKGNILGVFSKTFDVLKEGFFGKEIKPVISPKIKHPDKSFLDKLVFKMPKKPPKIPVFKGISKLPADLMINLPKRPTVLPVRFKVPAMPAHESRLVNQEKVSVENVRTMRGILSGKIEIVAKGAGKVRGTLESNLPGNLGFNMQGAY